MFEVQYVAWEIESRCNLGCLFCYSSSWNQLYRKQKKVAIPTLDEIKRGLDKLVGLGVRYVNWTGGEPLLREKQALNSERHGDGKRIENLNDILRSSSDSGVSNILSTNGWFSDIYKKERDPQIREKCFFDFLERIDPYLFFLAVSWDSGDLGMTNCLLRIQNTFILTPEECEQEADKFPELSKHASRVHQDVMAIIRKMREDVYHFNFKVNTLVTKVHQKEMSRQDNIMKSSLGILFEELKDITCIWKLTQFNPRECPKRFRRLFAIKPEEFLDIYNRISLEREVLRPAAKCVLASRLYDGENDPYCFLVINSDGEILLPLASNHIPLGRLYGPDVDKLTTDDFRTILEEKIYKVLADLPRTPLAGEYSRYFGDLPKDDKKAHLDKFSFMNKRIAASSYSNSRFLDVQADLNINKLAKTSREVLANVQTSNIKSLVDPGTSNFEERLKNICSISLGQEERFGHEQLLYQAAKMKLLYEQEAVARVIESSLGVIGGSYVILSKNETDYRITPFLRRAPYGLHFPWFFDESTDKREFFQDFFCEIKNTLGDDIFSELLEKRILPLDEVISVIDSLKIPKEKQSWLLSQIRKYLSTDPLGWNVVEQDQLSFLIPIVLNGCIERIAGKLHQAWLSLGEVIAESGAESDPLFKVFFHERERNLSPIEQDLNLLMISSEEAIYAVSQWLKLYCGLMFKVNSPFYIETRDLWDSFCQEPRVRDWIAYQSAGGPLAAKIYQDHFRSAQYDYASIPTPRVEPIYWFYLLNPRFYLSNPRRHYSKKRSYRFHVLPHTLFMPFLEDKENGLRAFTGVYFDDLQFKSFWQKKPWSPPASSVSRPEIIGYAHRLNAFLTPLSFYNARLEMQERVRQVFTQEGTKSAIASVMMRNMSHNIGSHVLARLTSGENLLSIGSKRVPVGKGPKDPEVIGNLKAMEEMDLKSLKGDGDDGVEELRKLISSAVETIKESANLNSYLKARMDLLADIATSEPIMVTGKMLQQEVIQYFKPISGTDLVRVGYPFLLIENISGTDLGENDIEIRFQNGDIRAAIPNDLLGAQALYIIFENIIRNCAKHSGGSYEGGKLVLTITAGKFNSDLYCLKVSDNVKHTEEQVGEIRFHINNPVLDKNYKLRSGGWGLLEMKLAAAYLRRIPISGMDAIARDGWIEYRKDGKLLKTPALLDVQRTADTYLQYTLYLEKPKELALLFENGITLNPALISSLKEYGIHVFSATGLTLSGIYEYVRDFPLIIVEENMPESTITYLANMNLRIIKGLKTLLQNIAVLDSPQKLIAEVWEGYVGENWKIVKKSIGAEDDESENNGDELYKGNSQQDAVRQLTFDHHGMSTDNVNDYYYEPYASLSGTNALINMLIALRNDEHGRKRLAYEMVDAAATTCVVVDERIQKEGGKVDKQKKGTRTSASLKRMGIFIPTNEIDLDLGSKDFGNTDHKAILLNWIKGLNPKPSYAIVHLTLIEKMQKSTCVKAIEEWIDGFSREVPEAKLIIVSGRGTPSNLPPDVLFVPYTLISRYLLEDRSKFHLCKVLASARRREH